MNAVQGVIEADDISSRTIAFAVNVEREDHILMGTEADRHGDFAGCVEG